MTQQFPLQTLLELSQLRVDEATKRLGQLLASEQAGEQKLALLIQYRDEYRTRFMAAARLGLEPEQWRNFSAFLDRLEEAIGQQQSLVQTCKQRTADGQKKWVDERNRFRAFDTLSQRFRDEEVRLEGKAEQKLTDEHAAKSYRTPDED